MKTYYFLAAFTLAVIPAAEIIAAESGAITISPLTRR